MRSTPVAVDGPEWSVAEDLEEGIHRARKMLWRHLAATLLLAAGLGGAEATSAPVSSGTEGRKGAVAPADIRLERVIATRKDLGRGRLLRLLTGRGNPSLFLRPFGVAWDADDLLVTDPGRGTLLRIAADGRLSETPSGLFQSPIGTAACEQGILVSDSRLGRVALVDRDLRLLHWVAEGLERPTGVACDGQGRLFIVETARHRVLVLESSAAPAAEPGVFEAPGGRSTGQEFPTIDERHRIVRILGGRGDDPGEFNFPTVVAPSLDTLWVADTLNFRIQGFSAPTGEITATFGSIGDSSGEMPRLKGLTVDAGGRLWVSDSHLEQIALYQPDGAFLTSLGGPGSRPGDFSFPAGLAAHPDGRVAVVDSFNRRIQIFRIRGGSA